MKRAKQRRPYIHPIALWEFCRGLRKMSEASERCARNLRRMVPAYRAWVHSQIPPSVRARLATAESETAILLARVR